MKININKISDILKNNDEFEIYTHKSPDGDAVASAFALAIVLQSLDKKASVKCCDPFPDKFNYLINDFNNDKLNNPILVGVDIAGIGRLGSYSDERITVCIDHHSSNKCDIENTYLEADAVSCSLILYKIFKYMGIPIPKRALELIFTGIVTDSSCFQLSSTNAETYAVAAELADKIDTHSIINKVYLAKNKNELKVEQELLKSFSYYNNDQLVIAYLRNDTINLIGKSNTGGLSTVVMKSIGIKIGVTILEKSPNIFNLSFKSSCYDVSIIAKEFGGGGHENSAGAIVETEDLDSLIKNIIDMSNKLYSF